MAACGACLGKEQVPLGDGCRLWDEFHTVCHFCVAQVRETSNENGQFIPGVCWLPEGT